MNKQKKQLSFLVGVLVLCMAGYVGLGLYQRASEKREEKKAAAEAIKLTDYSLDAITGLHYTYEEQDLTFEKKDGVWTYSADASLSMKSSALDTMAGKAAAIVATDRIEGVTELAQYGLDTPAQTISFTADVDGTVNEHTFHVGNYNDIVSVYYIYEGDAKDTVYAVEGAAVNAFHKTLEELTEVPEETTEVSQE